MREVTGLFLFTLLLIGLGFWNQARGQSLEKREVGSTAFARGVICKETESMHDVITAWRKGGDERMEAVSAVHPDCKMGTLYVFVKGIHARYTKGNDAYYFVEVDAFVPAPTEGIVGMPVGNLFVDLHARNIKEAGRNA